MKENTVKDLRFLYQREHDLLNQRTNIFLLAQTILVGAFTYASSNKITTLIAVISTIGIFYSCLWLIITIYGYQYYNRIAGLLAEYENQLDFNNRLYIRISPFIKEKKKIPIVSIILAWIFPISWIFLWLTLYLLTFFNYI